MIPVRALPEIRAAYDRCQQRFATVQLELEVFQARVEEAVSAALGGGTTPEPESWLDVFSKLHHEDLFLATACSRGDRIAWEYFADDYLPLVRRFASQACRRYDESEDLAQDLVAALIGNPEREDSRLGSYQGRGSLAGWLRVTVAHGAIDRFRRAGREVSLEEMEELRGRSTPSEVSTSDAAEERLDERWGSLLTRLLSEEIATLPARDRLLLGMYYLHEIPLKAIGRQFGVHEATASRWLESLRQKIRKRVDKALRRRHGLTTRDLKHLWESVSRDDDLNLEKLLADSGDP